MSELKIIDLVFEGGGMKGIAFCGALRILAAKGYRPGRLLGASIGSMVATLLAAGYTADELFNLVIDAKTGELIFKDHFMPFPSLEPAQIEVSATRRLLKSVDLPFLPNFVEGGFDSWLAKKLMGKSSLKNFFNYLERAGTYNPEPFIQWLQDLLGAKIAGQTEFSMSTLTMAEFHKITGFNLSLLAADVTNPTMLILNHKTAPDCPVVQAVRMATAAPTFFPPVVWQAEWGTYGKRELTGELIVDGGVLSNFPIELFLSQHETVTDILGKPGENTSVLGLLLDESQAVPGAPVIPTNPLQESLTELPGFALVTRLIRTIIEARDKRDIEAASDFIVRLPAGDYAPFMLDLTPDQLRPLFNASHNAMMAHLEKYPPSAKAFDDSTRRQLDHTAMHIINVYGNLINVNQEIGEISDSGSVVAVKIGADDKENKDTG